MKSRRFVLTFPPDATGEPITLHNLIRKYDIVVADVDAEGRCHTRPGRTPCNEVSFRQRFSGEGMEYMRQRNVKCTCHASKKITLLKEDMSSIAALCSYVASGGADYDTQTTHSHSSLRSAWYANCASPPVRSNCSQ